MGLGDHINIHLKQGVQIITCDPPTGVIEAETRNGEVISINAYHQTPTFRWPVPGEKWMVTEENGSWFLDGIYEQQIPYEVKTGEPTPVQPGDTVISTGSSVIWKNVGGALIPLKNEGKWQTPEKFTGVEEFGKTYIPSTIHDTWVSCTVGASAPDAPRPGWLVSVVVQGVTLNSCGYGGGISGKEVPAGIILFPLSFIVPAGMGFSLLLSEEGVPLEGPKVVITGSGFVYTRFE